VTAGNSYSVTGSLSHSVLAVFDLFEAGAVEGDVGGFGEGDVGCGLVGGVGLEEQLAGEGGGGDAGGAPVARIHEGAAEGDADASFVQLGKEPDGAGIGMQEDAGGMWRAGEQIGKEQVPCAAAMDDDGARKLEGKVELGA